MFEGWSQQSKWRLCIRIVLPKSSVLSCVFFFLWAKGLNTKDIRKEMFPANGGKCFSRKAVYNWVTNVSLMTKRLKRSCGSGRDNSQKTSMCCGFRRTGKAMGQVYQCWWKICREINAFSRFEYHMLLLFISICDIFTDSPSYNSQAVVLFCCWMPLELAGGTDG
jgi:hypothetical protein